MKKLTAGDIRFLHGVLEGHWGSNSGPEAVIGVLTTPGGRFEDRYKPNRPVTMSRGGTPILRRILENERDQYSDSLQMSPNDKELRRDCKRIDAILKKLGSKQV